MAYYVEGVAETTNGSILDGVFLRLGECSPDETNTNIYPSTYGGTKDESEGVFLTSCGNFVLHVLGKAFYRYESGLKQTFNGANSAYTTTVNSGNHSKNLKGKFEYKSKKVQNYTSDSGSISIISNNAAVSLSSKNEISYYNTYSRIIHANRETSTKQTNTSVHGALAISGYGSMTLSKKIMAISMKGMSLSIKPLAASVAILSLKVYGTSMKLAAEDLAVCYIYAKTRAVQVESGAKHSQVEGLKYYGKAVRANTAAAATGTSAFKGGFGMICKLPG